MSDIARKVNLREKRWDSVHFVDDIRTEKEWYGLSVFRFEDMLADKDQYECVISLGEPTLRKLLYDKLLNHDVTLATLIDPTADISPSASIKPGCIVGSRSFISSNTTVDDNVMLEVQTIVGHDIFIGKHSVVSSCSVVGGCSQIGSETFIGINCSIKERARVGDHCIIGMGSAVFKNIDDGYIALGNPARPVRKNDEGKVFSQ